MLFFVFAEDVGINRLVENDVTAATRIKHEDATIAGVNVTFVFFVITVVDPRRFATGRRGFFLGLVGTSQGDLNHVRRVTQFDHAAA
jgi:hypothetical protein